MTASSLSTKIPVGSKIWIQQPSSSSSTVNNEDEEDQVWITAQVIEHKSNDNITYIKLYDKDTGQIIPLPSIFHLKNDTTHNIQQLTDLTQLTHLHEPAVLHSINSRFDHDLIYTFTGPILIAVNPFKTIPDLYSETVCVKSYNIIHSIIFPLSLFRHYNDLYKMNSQIHLSQTPITKHLMFSPLLLMLIEDYAIIKLIKVYSSVENLELEKLNLLNSS